MNVICNCWRLTVFSLGTTIWQIFTNVSCLRSYHKEKNRNSFDPRSQTLSGEDSTWMVDRLEIPRIVDSFLLAFSFFFPWLNEFSCFQRWVVFCQAAWKSNCRHCWCIVTLHACWVVNKNVLLAFYSVSSVLFRDKRRSIKEQNAMKSHNKTQT